MRRIFSAMAALGLVVVFGLGPGGCAASDAGDGSLSGASNGTGNGGAGGTTTTPSGGSGGLGIVEGGSAPAEGEVYGHSDTQLFNAEPISKQVTVVGRTARPGSLVPAMARAACLESTLGPAPSHQVVPARADAAQR